MEAKILGTEKEKLKSIIKKLESKHQLKNKLFASKGAIV